MASCFLLVMTLPLFTSLVSAAGRGIAATDEYLTAHNAARAEVSVAPLKWSTNLTSEANLLVQYQQNKSNCSFANLSSENYGANQATAGFKPSPAQVVALWVAEKKWYVHSNNSCVAGHQCGTYTQVVWRTTKELGCAQAVCGGRSSISICFYHPPGNWQGESPY